jgi:2,3,4,5-tetrahydropyridine-2-carboxylate N-succinyltransferase/tetrahydrodipicolinate N-acetyltransferase
MFYSHKEIPMDSARLIEMIATSKKSTPVQVFLSGNFDKSDFDGLEYYGSETTGVLFCDLSLWQTFARDHASQITKHRLICECRNSALPLTDYTTVEARIEPGAVIRTCVTIGANAVILMGAIINVGAEIGERTMIDMNAVIGGRAIIGKDCHIGAGAVVAGVIEPPSATPVIIQDHVLVGANAVILEGVQIGEHSVIAAGSVVTRDVPPYSVVAGVPGKVVKQVDQQTLDKTQLIAELRNL